MITIADLRARFALPDEDNISVMSTSCTVAIGMIENGMTVTTPETRAKNADVYAKACEQLPEDVKSLMMADMMGIGELVDADGYASAVAQIATAVATMLLTENVAA